MALDSVAAVGSRRCRIGLPSLGAALAALALGPLGGSASAIPPEVDATAGAMALSSPSQPSGSGPDPEPPLPAPGPEPPAPGPGPEPPAPGPAPPAPGPAPPVPVPPIELPTMPAPPVARVAIGIVSPTRAAADSVQTYTVVVINRGVAPAENVTVVQDIVAQLGIVDPDVAALRVGEDAIAWGVGTLAAGERWRVSYRVRMPADPAVVVGTRARVTWDGGASATDPVRTILGPAVGPAPAPSVAPQPAPPVVVPAPREPTAPPAAPAPVGAVAGDGPRATVRIGIVAPRRARPGSRQVYTIVMVNPGAADAEDVRVEQAISAGITIPDAAAALRRLEPRRMVWSLGTIPAGGRWRVEYPVIMPRDIAVAGTRATVIWDGGSASTAAVRTLLG